MTHTPQEVKQVANLTQSEQEEYWIALVTIVRKWLIPGSYRTWLLEVGTSDNLAQRIRIALRLLHGRTPMSVEDIHQEVMEQIAD